MQRTSFRSAAARAFGATVDVPDTPATLYLVVGRTDRGPRRNVVAAGGEVLTVLTERRVLALLTFRQSLAVSASPEIVCAGAVTVDQERFARFVALAGLDAE